MKTSQLATRYPRLLKSIKWAAILCDGEALGCLAGHLAGWGGGEAVQHFGGTTAVIRAGIRCRHYVRTLNLREVRA